MRTRSQRYGGHGERETPGPIPNPEAKPLSADGTAPETGWESRTPPDNHYRTGVRATRSDPRSRVSGPFSTAGRLLVSAPRSEEVPRRHDIPATRLRRGARWPWLRKRTGCGGAGQVGRSPSADNRTWRGSRPRPRVAPAAPRGRAGPER